ncbi:type I polyketide synthase [Actinomadura verrucosospora]|uniref:Type I modular polyketide synthase n=1 Tax=Actinomadura verrucosospora TaxID=46165 RepID=A0A7D3VTZ2_ACTVE|nr:type I polyketide synthase [Actinomadura verrucosospora]QKG19191.1 Type I modular polyketide synthase [Actinomadura verrucosospora]
MESQEKLFDYLKKASAELQETRRRLRKLEADEREPVAIVAMSCRYPGGADGPDRLWELLARGGDAVAGFPGDRGWEALEEADGAAPVDPAASYVRAGGFVPEATGFDAAFFGISPREALAMDPQQRLLLEVAWEALERAGIDPRSLRGSRTGVFAGASASGYGAGLGDGAAGAEGYLLTGNAGSVISGRLSYVLGLEGPAVTVDTACSSSLVALHLACQALRSGECALALAGGVTVMATPATFMEFSRQQGLAADGRCKSFAAAADGTGWAEGAGMLLVERLSDARRLGHPVLAVVRGSAVNQDGASNGLTAPNGPSQQRVIRAALADARLRADQVDAVEAHGTGTTLGDPIEAQALLATYGQDRPDARPLWLGSVKSNIGHAQCAAGVAGVMKMVLALRHDLLPATLHVDEPSPHVNWSAGHVRLLTEAKPWPCDGRQPRRAGVSAFGISGTNAHVIVEEAPDPAPTSVEEPLGGDTAAPVAVLTDASPVWLVSGRSADGLAAQAGRLREFVVARPELGAVDVGWSLATTRSVFEHRAVVAGGDRGELVAGLASVATQQPAAGVVTGAVPAGGPGRVVFVFPGQGSQWLGMGRELAASSPVFAARLAECAEALAPYVDWSLEDVLVGVDGAPGLETADVVQPVLWAVMVSLAGVWEAAGVEPDAVVGHSQGEIAAACVAGILSLEDAAKVVALRSRALTVLAGRGGMLSVAEPAVKVRERLAAWGERLSVAAVNGPAATVVSGEPDALAELAALCTAQDVRNRLLPVDYASHHAQIEGLKDEILSVLEGIVPGRARVPMVSAMTGAVLDGPELDASYWYASLRATVEFDRAIRVLGEAGHRMFVEVSPHPVLVSAITDALEEAEVEVPAVVVGTLRRDDGGADRLVSSLAEAHVQGAAVNWTTVLPAGQKVELPTYAFQHQRYWPDVSASLLAQSAKGDRAVAESRFWTAVEGGDVAGLADALAVDGQQLGEVLPALAAWWRRERDGAATADWRYRISWVPVADTAPAVLSGTWLVVLPAHRSADEVGAGCVQALTAHGAHVVTVEVPARDLDRTTLAARLTKALADNTAGTGEEAETARADVAGVVSLLALDESPIERFPAVVNGLAGSLALVQALLDAEIGGRLWMLTRSAVAAGTDEASVGPVQAQVWGLGRVAGLEHPDRWGGLIDMPEVLDERAASRLCMLLAGSGEDQVAIRPTGIVARRLVRAPQPRIGAQWKPGGTVLVTGGTGAAGGHVARWLTERDARRIVLTSRSGAHASGTARLAAELAAAGSTVEVVACDTARRADVTELLAWIGRSGPALTSVIHAAGIGDGALVDQTTAEDLAAMLSAKATGAALLDELTAGMDLDAFVMFSSGAAIWGSGGLAGYAAANAFLDGLAECRRARGLVGSSVAWGLWGGGGMGSGESGDQLQRLGMRVMDPDLAVRALGQVLDGGECSVVVADVDWARFVPVFTLHRPSPLISSLPEVGQVLASAGTVVEGVESPLVQRLAGLSRADQDRLLVDVVRAEAAVVLGHASAEAVEPGRAFKELGFDSLTAVELRNRLRTACGLSLPSTLVFDYPTARAVAGLLRSELLGDQVPGASVQVVAAPSDEPIAIVGMSCRYPGGITDPDGLWDLVAEGTDAISGFPQDRGWEILEELSGSGSSDGIRYTRQGGFVYDAPGFDAGFFGISPREALAMDPQQRLLLETSWEVLEQAGIDPEALRGSATGVFAGAAFSGYTTDSPEAAGYQLTGGLTAVISGRVAYTLGLEGPAVTVDTACSSSLVALHLACQSLRAGECTLALAGGVAVLVTPGAFAEFSHQQGMAADGRCKPFAAAADGIGWGEGAGMILVERLSDAQRNGHQVLAVLRGSAINQDGASNGLTAPNGPSQQRVIRAALANAQVPADQVDMVEAHGTGTTLGDPIEAQALLATYGQDRPDDRPLWLGSVKSNIGHTGAAAGIAGVIKTVLALRHRQLPRTLHVDDPSPHVDWAAGQVRLLTEPRPWSANGHPRRAAVSAFGVSGTNAHVIIEEAAQENGEEPAPRPDDDRVPVLADARATGWVVSARTAGGLAAQAGRLREFVASRPDLDPADVAWSLVTTRSAFEHRAAVVGDGRDELLAGLAAVAAGAPAAGVVSGVAGDAGRVVFVFPGQGSQWLGMGRELAACSSVFAAKLAECAEALAPYVDWSLQDVLAGADGAPGLETADVVQPALWAVMVSLAAVWESAGVRPDAVVGHSQGEIAAACVAGILSLEDAAKVVALRSKALTVLAGRGGMLSVAEDAGKVRERLSAWGERLSVAAVNGPAASVVSGEPDALNELAAACASDGVRTRMLPVDYASHHAQVEALREEIAGALSGIAPGQSRVPMVSAMTGEFLDGPELDPSYWYASLRTAVEFDRAVRALGEAGHRVFVEVSPHPVLTAAITDTLDDEAAVIGTLRRDDGGASRLLTSLAEAHAGGTSVDWAAVLPAGRRVGLPTYAFQHQRYWPEIPQSLLRQPGSDGAGTAAEARFWAAVEGGDLTGLADALAVDGRRLGAVLPALAAWRRREQDEAAVADWRYRVSWQAVTEPGAAALSGTWLLLAPAGRTDDALVNGCVRALTDRGAQVTVADVGPDDLDRTALAARLGHLLPEASAAGVVSLLALEERRLSAHPAVPSGLAGTMLLLQALGDAGVEAPLWVVTSGAVAAGPGEAPSSPVQAQAWGLGRVAGLEHPGRWGGLIDLPPVLDDRAAARLCAVLAGCGEDQVAVRPSGILARRLVRAAPRRDRTRRELRGTVLATGATGGIGPYLAEWLAGSGASNVVLTSRRGPGMQDAARLAAKLAAAGTGVALVACDVAERDQVAGLLDWIEMAAPLLRTVIHAAVGGDRIPLDRTDLAELAAGLAAKVDGARWLDELTADRDLDAFVLFSSIAATWGSSDHGAYAAANAHLDALAMERRSRGLPATSVAWGVWDTREDVTAELDLPRSVTWLLRQGMKFMRPAPALAALGQVLADDETFLAVADVDWTQFAPVFTAVRAWPLLDQIPEVARLAADAPAEPTGELAARLAGATPAERERVVADLVRVHAAAVLGHASPDEVGVTRAFRDMGFDSLTAVELRHRLNAETGLKLPSTAVFDYPSPQVLARQITDRLLGVAEAAPAVPVQAAASDEPIAIVGMGCRFPGGVNAPEQLWDLLASGGDAVCDFPADRGWDVTGLFDPDPDHPGTSYTSQGGFVFGAGEFDPGFFGISPREALAMDPQQRLLLETAWEALERAGIDPLSLRGTSTGVFAGASPSGYLAQSVGTEGSEGHLITGNVPSVISGRVSYVLGLEGPAVTVDTACSSSLVALHLACQAVRAGECGMALAGGVAVMADPAEFVGFSRQRVLAADGRCKAFGALADGMGLAEGAGMVLVERLSDAQRNGHPVLAVVRGSAINQDGASNGLTAPNGPSQQRVIRAALANARLSAAEVDAVEGHGTGTTLGDPIEAQALLATYGQDRPDDRPLWLGSIKSNIGHAQQAAGVAGVIKTVLALQHRELPRTLHADEPTPHVDWSTGAVRLLNETVQWPTDEEPRRVGVSAFGISGTNAHIILEEAPAPMSDEVPEAGERPAPVLTAGPPAWPVSARTAGGLAAQAGRLREFVMARPALDPVDVGWSLVTTRSAFEHRAVVTGDGSDDLLAGLTAVAAGEPAAGVVSGVAGESGRVVFVFPGQGSQWIGMGRELAASSPIFAARLAECAAALAPFVDWSLQDVLAGVDGAPGLETADVVQPVLWAVMVSLAAVWEAAGIQPDAVVGHSQGEIAAACVAGILSLEDAAKVVALRSKALTVLAGRGGMLSVAEPADKMRERLAAWGERLSVAAVNGPAATVVSGESEALDELAAACEAESVRTRLLPVDYASHSAQVEAIKQEILDLLKGIVPGQARIPMVSAMTGEFLDGPELDASYWYASLRAPVEFDRAIRVLAEAGHQMFIETSPHPVLTAPITDTLDEATPAASRNAPVTVIGTLRRDDGGPARLITSLAEAYAAGVSVQWTSVLPTGDRVDLPTYAFQRERFWPAPVTPEPTTGSGDGAEADFWAAVEDGDVTGLAETLAVDDQRLSEVLPALASWRRQERNAAAVSDWRYRVSWVPVPESGPVVLSGTWLLIVPTDDPTTRELVDGCARALTDRGARVIVTEAAPASADRASLASLLTQVVPEDRVTGVVSLLALDERPAAGVEGVAGGVSGTLALVQALGDLGVDAPLWVLTRGAVAAGDTAAVSAVQAQVWGLCRVAGLEHPDRWGGLVDLPPVWNERTAGRLCAVLAAGAEDQVALRTAGIIARRLVRAPRPAAGGGRWAPRGSVLLTGGTGGVGGHVARWLTGRGAAGLVLVSRSGPGASGAAALAAELAERGTAVEVIACDTGRRSRVAGLLARIAAGGPPLTSVFHAAGTGQTTAVQDMGVEELAGLLSAKAVSAAHLDELTAGLDLDAFVLFSSGSAVWGSRRLPGYAAANAFLDGLAESRRARGLPATSIAWGLWGGGGMGEGDAGDQLQRLGLRVMDPAPAVRALGQVLDGGESLITVADVDWERFAPVFTLHRPSPLIADLPEVARALADGARADEASGEAGDALAARLDGLPRAEQDRVLADLVRAEAAAVLGHRSADAVPGGRAFRDLGFDSLTAVELRNRLTSATGLKLPATLVFDYPSSVVLAGHLAARIRGEGGTEPLLAELDRLEAALADVPADGDLRASVTVRLQTVLSKWMSAEAAEKENAVVDRLESASADEVLDFIDKEFGAS